jgi:hypothetical protein
MVRRCALVAGIGTKIRNHTFRATGSGAFLKNGGTLENAAAGEPLIDAYDPAVMTGTMRSA